MFCSSCGEALPRQMNFCNRCGAQLLTTKETAAIELSEKRLHEEMVDLFWVTVIGLGLILGGMALMKNGLHLGEGLVIAYLLLSSTAFTINFALGLWQILRLARMSREAGASGQIARPDTNELSPGPAARHIEAAPSIIESTTRKLKPSAKEHST